MLLAAFTEPTVRALEQVRNPATFSWTIVVLIALVSYVYTVEVEAKRWPVVFAGIGFFLMDLFNEVVNSLVLHFSEYSALWTTTGPTIYQPLIGLNAEIMFVFSIAGVVFVRSLPEDPKMKILGINNRLFLVTAFSIFSVMVELVLRAGGIFHWAYWWWNWPFIPLIVVFGYMTFYGIAAWIFDMGDNTSKQLRVLGIQGAIVLSMIVVFGPLLGWL